MGIDVFSIKSIKTIIPYIAEQLTDIFNKSIVSGIFPDSLKYDIITSVFKTEDKCMVGNYGPICVLPVFSIVLEKLMHKRLVSFLVDKCNVIKTNQYGFRENYATYMTLLTMLDQISQAIDNNKYASGLLTDFSKVFNTIEHHILLQKLATYNIIGNALKWLSSYLSERTHCVSPGDIRSIRSNFSTIRCGVPQLSVLVP